MTENERIEMLKVACTRLARTGLQLIQEGDPESGVAFVKVAEALAQGHTLQDTLDYYFPPQTHEKVAHVLDEVAATPSLVAKETFKQAAVQEVLRRKQAAAQGGAYSQHQKLANFGQMLQDPAVRNALIGGLGGVAVGGIGGALGGGKKKR